MPGFAEKSDISKFKTLEIFYDCLDSIIEEEWGVWCHILHEVQTDTSFLEVFDLCNKSALPNIHNLLTILETLPVATCSVGRSLSTMKRIKTLLSKKTSTKRLTKLILMSFLSREIGIDSNDLINGMNWKNRRWLF